MKILALFAKLLDALAILLVYMAGRRDARQEAMEKELDDVRKVRDARADNTFRLWLHNRYRRD